MNSITKQNQTNITEFPKELIYHILSFCDNETLMTLCRASKYFNSSVNTYKPLFPRVIEFIFEKAFEIGDWVDTLTNNPGAQLNHETTDDKHADADLKYITLKNRHTKENANLKIPYKLLKKIDNRCDCLLKKIADLFLHNKNNFHDNKFHNLLTNHIVHYLILWAKRISNIKINDNTCPVDRLLESQPRLQAVKHLHTLTLSPLKQYEKTTSKDVIHQIWISDPKICSYYLNLNIDQAHNTYDSFLSNALDLKNKPISLCLDMLWAKVCYLTFLNLKEQASYWEFQAKDCYALVFFYDPSWSYSINTDWMRRSEEEYNFMLNKFIEVDQPNFEGTFQALIKNSTT